MIGASVAYGLRAALAEHEGTALHRFAVEALDTLAAVIRVWLGEIPGPSHDQQEQLRAFADGWVGYPTGGPPDVFSWTPDPPPARFYALDWWPDDHVNAPIGSDTTAMALRHVPEGCAVVHVEPMTRQLLHLDPPRTVFGTRLYIDRRPPGRG